MEIINEECFIQELKILMKKYKVNSITLEHDDPTIYFSEYADKIFLEGDIYFEENTDHPSTTQKQKHSGHH